MNIQHKRGDTFEVDCLITDDFGKPEAIGSIEISSQIRTQRLDLVADLIVIKHEIEGDDSTRGRYSLLCVDTTEWVIGQLLWDIKYTENGKSLRTETNGIDVVREITQ